MRPYLTNGCVHRLFEAQVEKTPEAIAAVCADKPLTYRQLNSRANQLAHCLKASGAGPEALVAICMERSLELPIGLLGILKAGAAYVPLDPAYPKERLAFMLEASRAQVLLTQQRLTAGLLDDRRSEIRSICVDNDRQLIDRHSTENPVSAVVGENAAYAIFTSGSTGLPKAVVIQHGSLANYNEVARTKYALEPSDRVLQFAPISFDASVEEIFPTLTSGATLFSRTDLMLDPLLFLQKCAEWNLTVLSLPTVYWHELTATLAANAGELPSSVRLVILGGERANPKLVAKWREHVRGGVRLINTYGPTEATVVATLCDVSDWGAGDVAGKEVPIGRPIPNTWIHLLDTHGCPVPVGTPGELCISGASLSRGYLGRPDSTADRFIPNLFSEQPGDRLYRTGDLARCLPDGNIEFLGRLDDQVKIRGFRVEPREIEAALEKYPGIDQVVVVASEDMPNGNRLVAYFVPQETTVPTAGELRDFLSARLPDYMIPPAFVKLDTLPLSPNGKVDKKTLPAPSVIRSSQETNYLPPRTALERLLADLWGEVLGIEDVGIYDNFFRSGGDSLQAARLINTLQARLGEYVYIAAIFDAPTVADLARYLCQHYPASIKRNFGPSSLATSDPTTPPDRAMMRRRVDARKVEQMRRLISPLSPWHATDGAKNPPAVFVLSPPRSGSTLLRVMLAGHPRLLAPQELDLLSFNTLEDRKTARLSGGNVGFLEGTIRAIMEIKSCDLEAAKSLMEDCERRKMTTKQFYGLMQQWIGDRMLVDKSTSYALDQEILQRAERYFEAPFYIHLVRHPYGMIHSFEEVRMDQVFFRNQNLFAIRELAELIWLVCHENILRFFEHVPDSRKCRVKFEDLVRSPRVVMEGICRFLGLEFDPDLLEPYKDKEKRMTDGLHAESRMVGDVKFHQHTAIDPRVADEWQNHYTEDGLGEITWRLAESLGYHRDEETSAEATPVFTQNHASEDDPKDLSLVLAELEKISDTEAERQLAQQTRLLPKH